MAGEQYFAIRNYSLDASDWQVIQAPMPCNYWVVRPLNGNVLICSDVNNPGTTQDTIQAGTQEGVIEKQNPVSGARYPSGATFCYLKAQSGTVDVVVTFAL